MLLSLLACCFTLQLRVTGSPRATTVSEGCSRITGAEVEQQPGRNMDFEGGRKLRSDTTRNRKLIAMVKKEGWTM